MADSVSGAEDRRWMALALSLGARGQGLTWPNPSVGCVLVGDGRVVGRGWTQRGGRPHAERVALEQAGPAAHFATAYVTLEPCSHHGKTSPCSDALIAAGVSRVVISTIDPDPRVSGRGIARLEDAGVSVTTGVCKPEAEAAHRGYFMRQSMNRPAVTLKLASSFDGRIATKSGQSQWITGPLARRAVHAMRARHDAVMVGGGTARADHPSLTVRDMGDWASPLRIILSEGLDLPTDGPLADGTGPPVWLVHGKRGAPRVSDWQQRGAVCLQVGETDQGLDVENTLKVLGEKGLTRIFCEGGGAVAASLLAADLVDDLIGFTAGLVIGAEGLPAVGELTLKTLETAPRFELVSQRGVGPDLMHHWRRRRPVPQTR